MDKKKHQLLLLKIINMFKKVLKYLLISFLSVFGIYIILFQIQTYFVTKTIEGNFLNSGVTDEDYTTYQTIRCDLNIFQPKIAFVNDIFFDVLPEFSIYFFDVNNGFKVARSGGTTIENTTFDELVEMVKKDCSQFQQAKGDPSDKTINSSYSPYTPEPPKEQEEEITEEEAAARRQRALDIYKIKIGEKSFDEL